MSFILVSSHLVFSVPGKIYSFLQQLQAIIFPLAYRTFISIRPGQAEGMVNRPAVRTCIACNLTSFFFSSFDLLYELVRLILFTESFDNAVNCQPVQYQSSGLRTGKQVFYIISRDFWLMQINLVEEFRRPEAFFICWNNRFIAVID